MIFVVVVNYLWFYLLPHSSWKWCLVHGILSVHTKVVTLATMPTIFVQIFLPPLMLAACVLLRVPFLFLRTFAKTVSFVAYSLQIPTAEGFFFFYTYVRQIGSLVWDGLTLHPLSITDKKHGLLRPLRSHGNEWFLYVRLN